MDIIRKKFRIITFKLFLMTLSCYAKTRHIIDPCFSITAQYHQKKPPLRIKYAILRHNVAHYIIIRCRYVKETNFFNYYIMKNNVRLIILRGRLLFYILL
jgi:hypothetical protein